MQLSHPNREVIAKSPRRTHRGALMPAALLAVLVLTILLSQFASAQLRHASAARSEARAVWLAAIAADFDYYVHHKSKPDDQGERDWPESGFSERALTDTEQDTFERDFLRVGLAEQMPNVTVEYLILRGKDGTDVFGALRLIGSDGRDAEMEATMARLARYGDEQRPVQDFPDINAKNGFERVILTAPLSGLNTAYVLRERRAGHAPPKFIGAGALDLGGHNLKVKNLTALGGGDSAAARVIIPQLDDQSAPAFLRAKEMTGTLTSLRRNPDIDEPDKTGNVNIAGTTVVSGAFEINDQLDADALTSSGNLNIGGIILIHDWVKTDRLTTAKVGPTNHLTAQSMTLTDAARTSGPLTADTLQSPAVAAGGEFTAGQVFTRDAEIDTLEITGECHGC